MLFATKNSQKTGEYYYERESFVRNDIEGLENH